LRALLKNPSGSVAGDIVGFRIAFALWGVLEWIVGMVSNRQWANKTAQIGSVRFSSPKRNKAPTGEPVGP